MVDILHIEPKSRGPEQSKQRAIVDEIRAWILSGAGRPGERLPTYGELRDRHGVTGLTVSRSIRQLVHGGMVVSRERSGVFVAATPPHLTNFALAFPGDPTTRENWSRLCDTLHRESDDLADSRAQHGVRLHRFFNLANPKGAEDHGRLLRDARLGRFGGILFATHPWPIATSELLQLKGIPRLAVMSQIEYPTVSVYAFEPFLPKALNRFAMSGRKRVACLFVSTLASREHVEVVRTAAAVYGLEMQPHWIQYADPSSPMSARQCVELLLSAPKDTRCDALLIADDNLIEQAELGVLASGLRAPEDLQIIAHANFPQPSPHQLPMTRVGYDIRRMMRNVLDFFRQPRSDDSAQTLMLPSVFEEEVAPL